jgi:2-keto-4-pentenoate hydratase/2-oxohepta-3-ene-1,7-dioic acid hydratase in catechol pathway
MKICRFDDNRVGVIRDDQVFDITAYAERAIGGQIGGQQRAGAYDPLIASLGKLREMLTPDLVGCPRRSLAEVRLLSPVRTPGKIVAAPVNYRAHIAEMQASNVSPGHNLTDIAKAGLFLKAPSSLVGPSQGIAVRFPERRTDYEAEIVAIIGREASEVSRANALEYVAGYCVGLDITVRGTEDRSFRKSMDSYTVLGPWLTTVDEAPNPNNVRLTLHQNGEIRQDASTSDMVWDMARIIEFAASFYTLYPGDVIFTGTPQGVGPIKAGDKLRAEVEGLGAMDVAVRAYGTRVA